jgi:hypothetical protein
VAIVLALTSLLALGGCGEEARMATARPDPGPHPVVNRTQAQDVLARVAVAVEDGNEAAKVGRYGDRVVGPARELAQARMAVNAKDTKAAAKEKDTKKRKKITDGMEDPVSPAPLTDSRFLVPTGNDWPRFFVAAGRSEDSSTPVLRVLRSDDARSPYGLWAELAMVPGATLPEVSAVPREAAALAADTPGLLLTPEDALSAYADLLTKGTKSKKKATFGTDELRGQVAERLRDDRKALKGVADKVTDKHVADPDSVITIRTADGGALVVGAIRQTYVITVESGAGKITPKGDLAKIAGRTSFTKKLTRTSVEVVALAVPREGGGVVRLIAAMKGDVALKGS